MEWTLHQTDLRRGSGVPVCPDGHSKVGGESDQRNGSNHLPWGIIPVSYVPPLSWARPRAETSTTESLDDSFGRPGPCPVPVWGLVGLVPVG